MLLERYARTIVKRARWVVAGVLLLTIALGAATRSLTLRFDSESAFPQDDPSFIIDQEIRHEFGGFNFVVVAVLPYQGDVWQPAVLQAVADLTQAARGLPGIIDKNVVSLAAPSVRRVEVTDDGMREDYVMREVPKTSADVTRLRDLVRADPLLRGGVVTEDERAALVLLDFWPDTDQQQITAQVRDLLARHRSESYDLRATGGPILVAAEQDLLNTMPQYFAAVVGIMMLVLFASFRTWQGMALPLLTGFLSTVWGIGLMALTGVALGIWNQSVPVLVIIVAAGHSAQMLKRYYEELETCGDNGEAVFRSVIRTGPVMVAAGGTAALGFASLSFIGVPGMRDLGLAAAFGIGSAIVLEMTFMPALRALLRPRRMPPPRAFAQRFFHFLGSGLLTPRGRAIILTVATAIAVWAVAGLPRVRPAGSMTDDLPQTSPAVQDMNEVRRHFPGTVTMTVLFEGPPGSATALETLRGIEALTQAVASEPAVARVDSLVGLVEQIHRAFAPERGLVLPSDRALLAQLLFLGRGAAFERFVDRADTRTVVWMYLRSDEPADVRPVMARAHAVAANLTLPPGVVVKIAGGVGPMHLALQERVTQAKVLNIVALLSVIYVLSSLVLRSPIGGAFVVMPLLLAIAVTFGILAWGGMRFDLITASVLSTSIGIGADYALYFLYRWREEQRAGQSLEAGLRRALETSGRAVLFVAVAIALGFSAFTPSSFRAFHLTGLLTPASMLASCLAAVSVMPAALLVVRPRFLFGRGLAVD